MKNIKSVYKFEGILLLFNLLLIFIQESTFKYALSILVLGMLVFVANLIYSKKKDTNFFRGTATRILIAILIFYFVVIFLLGFLLGYSKTLFSTNPNKWLTEIVPVVIATALAEQLRYIFIRNHKAEKKVIYGITALLMIWEIVLLTNFRGLHGNFAIFVFICTTVMPIIAEGMLASYMDYHYGMLPTITYKLIMNTYLYVIPLMTNLGKYLYGALHVLIPFTVYLVLKKYLKPDGDIKEKDKYIKKINFDFITIPIILFLVCIIILVSGIFKYQMIAIATNSMVPVYERGDAILFEKVDKKTIEVDDIIVFEKDKRLIAHRVVQTKEDFSKRYFQTKGDANDSVDVELVSEEEVLGVVRRVTKYIGYPTVWLSELLGGEKLENE